MAVPPSAVPVTPKHGGTFLAAMKYGGTSLALMKYLSIMLKKHKTLAVVAMPNYISLVCNQTARLFSIFE